MKNPINMKMIWLRCSLVFIAFSFAFECFGQRQPILPYGNYCPKEVEKFAKGNSSKAKQYTTLLLQKTGESSIESLFQKVVVKDTTLEAGTYENSYWDVKTQKIKFFPGKKFTGEVTLYNNKIYEDILYKDTCINLLNAQKRFLGLIKEDQTFSPGFGETKELPQKLDLPKDIGSSVVVKEPDEVKVPDLNLPPVVAKKKTWPWIVGGAVLAGTGLYFLLRGGANSESGGGPSGVPVHWD